MTKIRVRIQLAEVTGSVNRWYCAQHYHRRVDHADTLCEYFVKSGGAADFERRFNDAMGDVNRWYCSQHYGRDIRDPEILWDYYMRFRLPDTQGNPPPRHPDNDGSGPSRMSMAC